MREVIQDYLLTPHIRIVCLIMNALFILKGIKARCRMSMIIRIILTNISCKTKHDLIDLANDTRQLKQAIRSRIRLERVVVSESTALWIDRGIGHVARSVSHLIDDEAAIEGVVPA